MSVTTQVEVWEVWKEDKVDLKKIIEQQKEERKDVEKVIKVIQTNERLLREVAERKRCGITYDVEKENIPTRMKWEREEMNVVKNILKKKEWWGIKWIKRSDDFGVIWSEGGKGGERVKEDWGNEFTIEEKNGDNIKVVV